MKRLIILCALLSFMASAVFAQTNQLPAFPGAEGFGKYTIGGRGGRVIYVTTLEDNNSVGSLRYAVNQTGARIILFKVSGTIRLKSNLNITNGDVTIAGQTAPGDGITLRDYTVYVGADNVVIRFMRFRMGDVTVQQNDAIWGREQKNIIIDHCSMSWSTDECSSFYDNENFTLQWCLLAESLRNSVHGKGKHGYGGIWGGVRASFHHNLLAHHDSRNPRFCGSRYSNNPDEELVDFRNNVIYNWGANTAYAAEGGHYNLVNNYYKAGPASSNRSRIIQPYADDGSNKQPKGTYGIFYVDGNYMAESSAVTNDNWQGVHMHSSFASYAPGVVKNDIKSETTFETGQVTTHTAEEAYEKVISYAGASLAQDSIDIRILEETASGTVTFTDGGNGSSNGLIDTQGAVGGWPDLKTEQAPADSDNDGMPDAWETANNLDPYSPDDAQIKSVDGEYPNLEVYINSLVADIVTAQNDGGTPTAVNEIKWNERGNSNDIKLFVDNAANQLNVSHTGEITEVKIYSVTGQLLANRNFNDSSIRMNISGLKNGVYIVAVRDAANQVYSAKILKY